MRRTYGMQIAECFLPRNGHMIRHRFDVATRLWVPVEPIPAWTAKPFRPMFAEAYSGAPILPAIAQPKLDGVRCIARAVGLSSRSGERIENCPHIEAALAPIFAAEPSLILDGELWARGLTLGRISGLLQSKAPATALAFHTFDIADAAPCAERLARLAGIAARIEDEAAQLVPSIFCGTEADLDAHYRECLAAGYEGQMIRNPAAPYRTTRCTDLLKRKPREDAEATIVGIEAHDSGRIVARLRRADGMEFSAPVPATDRECTRLARMGSALIGLEATYRFTGHLPSGLPRDATVKLIHEFPRM